MDPRIKSAGGARWESSERIGAMRRFLASALAILVLTAHAFAQTPAADIGAADRAAIKGVIESQIAAFRRDDGPAAFAFAAPAIKRMFGTPENFMDMVRGGYPQVYRPSSVGFGELLRADNALVQLVEIVGPDGLPVIAVYGWSASLTARGRSTAAASCGRPSARLSGRRRRETRPGRPALAHSDEKGVQPCGP